MGGMVTEMHPQARRRDAAVSADFEEENEEMDCQRQERRVALDSQKTDGVLKQQRVSVKSPHGGNLLRGRRDWMRIKWPTRQNGQSGSRESALAGGSCQSSGDASAVEAARGVSKARAFSQASWRAALANP